MSELHTLCSKHNSESLHAEMHICLTESNLRFSMTKLAMNRTAVDFVDEFGTRGRVFCLYIFHLVNALLTVPSLYRRWCQRSGDGVIRTNNRIGSSLNSLNNEALWEASMIAYRFHSDSSKLMFWPHRHEHHIRKGDSPSFDPGLRLSFRGGTVNDLMRSFVIPPRERAPYRKSHNLEGIPLCCRISHPRERWLMRCHRLWLSYLQKILELTFHESIFL